MSDKLLLSSFEVEGYRGIRRLSLPELGRVNLFVGMNNAGKTSLLEAIRLYVDWDANGGALLFDLLREHTDFEARFRAGDSEPIDPREIEALLAAGESLFYGGFSDEVPQKIRMRGKKLSADLVIRGPRVAVGSEEGRDGTFIKADAPLFSAQNGSRLVTLTLSGFLAGVPRRARGPSAAVMVPSGGLDLSITRERWDGVAIEGLSEPVEDALRILLPRLSRVLTAGTASRRSIFVKLTDVPRALPLQSMGDGVARVFGIAMALVLAKDGVLLIDEMENGLHHAVQQEVWNSIFGLAERLNVQVFATTHSWDTVVAFQDAANRSAAEGVLYRLDRDADGSIHAVRYSEEEVAIAAEQQIEVR